MPLAPVRVKLLPPPTVRAPVVALAPLIDPAKLVVAPESTRVLEPRLTVPEPVRLDRVSLAEPTARVAPLLTVMVLAACSVVPPVRVTVGLSEPVPIVQVAVSAVAPDRVQALAP